MSVSHGIAVAAAVTFVWLGMVLAISFLEAPLKFRAPGVTTRIGLGIGRLVFRALSFCELVFAVVIAAALFPTMHSVTIDIAFTVAIAALFFQTVVVRPLLARRTAEVLAGEDEGRRSRGHLFYIALEVVKVIALIVGGVALLAV
jgi:hypothetical protein